MAWIKTTEAAALLQISRQALLAQAPKLQDAGVAKRRGGKFWVFDEEQLNETYRGTTQPRVRSAGKGAPDRSLAQQAHEDVAGVTPPPYSHSRAKREHYLARLAELEVLAKEGQLIEVATVEKDAFELGRRVRDRLMGIPAREGAILAAMDDPFQVITHLEKALRNELIELCTSDT